MRTLYPRPTWEDAEMESRADEDFLRYEAARREYLAENCIQSDEDFSREFFPEPTTLAIYVLLHLRWLAFEIKHRRCITRGHDYGDWINLHDDPEVVETGNPDQPFVHLQGRLTGRFRNCERCGYQHGQGEY